MRCRDRLRHRRCGRDVAWRHLGRIIGFGKDDREGAALAGGAGELDRAAQQAHEFPRNRQAETCPAIPPADGAVGLMEGLEDAALLLGRNADPGIRHGQGDAAAADRPDRQFHLAGLGELEGVG